MWLRYPPFSIKKSLPFVLVSTMCASFHLLEKWNVSCKQTWSFDPFCSISWSSTHHGQRGNLFYKQPLWLTFCLGCKYPLSPVAENLLDNKATYPLNAPAHCAFTQGVQSVHIISFTCRHPTSVNALIFCCLFYLLHISRLFQPSFELILTMLCKAIKVWGKHKNKIRLLWCWILIVVLFLHI